MSADPADAYAIITAIQAILDNGLPAAAAVHLGGVEPGTVPPYVALYPDIGSESPVDRSLDDSVPSDLRLQATSVGATAEQALLLAGMVDTLLRTTVPVVPGRHMRPVRQEGSQPVRRDDESTTLWFGTAQYLVRSSRAT
ncbi:hypothetical protein HD597_010088 [Nonomuraea thailandensis]|uniref:DUF3168 domain-containing protein n=1 Tax=Nonomuraea thailandensis TaxID=1188745 RepID=A0A9X2K7D8_9ACTN|nr:hypothetical protein [Nonomuraea thailandensis]MCP2363068.1 hypothetical protein [Nonomuraea thailandensis]